MNTIFTFIITCTRATCPTPSSSTLQSFLCYCKLWTVRFNPIFNSSSRDLNPESVLRNCNKKCTSSSRQVQAQVTMKIFSRYKLLVTRPFPSYKQECPSQCGQCWDLYQRLFSIILLYLFFRFAGAIYGRSVNVSSGIVGER